MRSAIMNFLHGRFLAMISPSPPVNVVPIYLPVKGEDGAFRFHGSGSLIKHDGKLLLVTAAHVYDGDAYTNRLLIPIESVPGVPTALFEVPAGSATAMPTTNNRDDDTIDLAAIVLPNESEEKFKKLGFCFAIPVPTDQRPLEPDTPLYFIGYPGHRQKVHFWANCGVLDMKPNALSLFQVNGSEAAHLGFPLERHHVCRYLHPATRGDQAPEDPTIPRGMSGGTIWQILGRDFSFAGIITRWNEKGHMIGTNRIPIDDIVKHEIGNSAR